MPGLPAHYQREPYRRDWRRPTRQRLTVYSLSVRAGRYLAIDRPSATRRRTWRWRALRNRLALRANDAGVEAEPVHAAHVPRVLDFHAAVNDDVQAAVFGRPRAFGVDHAELRVRRLQFV